MKKIYQWQDINGKKHVLFADSLFEAKHILLCQHQMFIGIHTKNYLTKWSFRRQELIMITQQLATMIKAGLPIIDCLALLADEHRLLQWQCVLNTIKAAILRGETLSFAIAQHPMVFPPIYKEVLTTGELTGQLENSFERLAKQLDKIQRLNQQIKKSLRYPLFMLICTFAVSMLMLLVVLPQFTDIYQSFDAQLPIFTQVIISLSELLCNDLPQLVIITIALSFIYHFYIVKKYRSKLDQWQLQIPILGPIIITSCLTQIFETLSMTQQSGIPLLSGLKTAQATTSNAKYRQSLALIIQQIEQGFSLSNTMEQSKYFPHLCTQLIRVGEESGTLDIMLAKIAEYYQLKSETLTHNLSQKIEPLMMLIIAAVIGSLVIAMYLPIFQLGSIIH